MDSGWDKVLYQPLTVQWVRKRIGTVVERLLNWKAYLGLQRAEHFCFGEPGLHACGPTLELDHQNFMSSAIRARRCGHVGIAQSVTARYAYRYLPTLLVSSWTNAGSI